MNLRLFSSTEYFQSSTDHLQFNCFSTSLTISWDADSAGAVRCAYTGKAKPHNTSRLTMRSTRMLHTSQKIEGRGRDGLSPFYLRAGRIQAFPTMMDDKRACALSLFCLIRH